MVLSRETQLYRRDAKRKGTFLTPKERERLVKPYLPDPTYANSHVDTRSKMSRPVRSFVQSQIHIYVFFVLHAIFSVYIRARQTYHIVFNQLLAILYYHHRAPELIKQDVKNLNRLPEHLSVILELKGNEHGSAGLEALIDEVAEISAWCACVGIPTLSIYEKTGILKTYLPATDRAVSKKLHAYCGKYIPSLQIRAPHIPALLNSESAEELHSISSPKGRLSILLLSAEDGRSTLVDLTKTLTEMSQRRKLSPNDISLDLVDAELNESVMGEPDLLVLFGPNVELQGYPPWQVRLSEIFHAQDNTGVGYQIFLKALHSYAKAHMRFGR